jgi:multidrug efflux pump subunit AcrB
VTTRPWPCRPCSNLPPACAWPTVGRRRDDGELFGSFGLAMLTGVLCIYMVLVLLFKGFTAAR